MEANLQEQLNNNLHFRQDRAVMTLTFGEMTHIAFKRMGVCFRGLANVCFQIKGLINGDRRAIFLQISEDYRSGFAQLVLKLN